jgi:hypothetical protein
MADFEDEDAFALQQAEISSAVASSGDLIGTRSDGFASLRVAFADAPRFAAKIPDLEGCATSVLCSDNSPALSARLSCVFVCCFSSLPRQKIRRHAISPR